MTWSLLDKYENGVWVERVGRRGVVGPVGWRNKTVPSLFLATTK